MKPINILQSAVISVVLLGSATANAAAGSFPSLFHCYAYVHEGCFNDANTPNCSNDDYNALLDSCDANFPSQGTSRPAYTPLAAPTRQILSSAEYKRTIGQLRSAVR
jgi:hypothetical protein